MKEGLTYSLTYQLGHPPPYAPEELEGLIGVTCRAEDPPYGLEALPNLISLVMDGCGEIDLRRDLGHRPKLLRLELRSCGVTSLEGIAECLPNLWDLDVILGQVRDLRPALGLSKLKSAALAGNPLDEVSYREIYRGWADRKLLRETWDQALIREVEWGLMQRYVAAGLKLSAYSVHGETVVIAPGHTVHQRPGGTGVFCVPEDAVSLLEGGGWEDERTYLRLLKRQRYLSKGWKLPPELS